MDTTTILNRLGKIGGFAVGALATIAVALKEAVEKADAEGYKRGYADGERMAREELAAFKKRLAGIIEGTAEVNDQSRAAAKSIMTITETLDATVIRAPRGSVAPAVIKALKSSKRGMSPKEVADVAGIPENSARGSLNKLRRDRIVEKRGSLWFPIRNEEATGSPH